MIAPDTLTPGQVYFLAGTFRPEQWRYVGDIPSTNREPVYIFANDRRYPTRFYGIELLHFHPTETDAWNAVISNLEKALESARTLSEVSVQSN